MKLKSPEALAQQAVFDLIMRDAEPLIEQWVKDYLAMHKREASNRQLDKAAQRIIETLTSDRSRYHFANLRPVLNSDGKTWCLEHVQSHE
jgi:hypothetical protein